LRIVEELLQGGEIADTGRPQVDHVLALPEIRDDVVVFAGEGVDKGVPARASGQNIVTVLAAEDIVAVAGRRRTSLKENFGIWFRAAP